MTAAGFHAEYLPAARPSDYSGKRAMVSELFGDATEQQSIMIGMTPFEIALLLSHKRALQRIAYRCRDLELAWTPGRRCLAHTLKGM